MNVFKWRLAFAALFFLYLMPLASAAAADDVQTCSTTSGDVAIAACTRAINSGARGPSINYYNRATAYGIKGDNDRAIADFNEAIRLNPKYAYAYHNRGLVYRNRGDPDRAIADYNEAIRLNPRFAVAYNNRGNAYLDKGDTDRAFADYSEAIHLNPKSANAYHGRGVIYRSKGDNDRALADFNEAIRLNPKYVYAYNSRGILYERLGDTDKARGDFNAVLELPLPYGDRRPLEEAQKHLAALAAQSAVASQTSQPATAVIAPGAPPAIEDRRVALVIGNSLYENVPALPNPVRDARLVADVLKRMGFTSVTLLTDLKKDGLANELRKFANLAASSDWAVIYYAGHGMEVGGINYLVPVDATIATDRDIDFEAIPLDQVLNAAERANKLRLVMLDACRDNPFKARMKRTLTVASRSVSGGLTAIEPAAGTMVVYAAKDGQQASDGGIDSPFTLAFVKDVQTPGLEVRRLFDYVRDDVMEMTNNQQQPFSYGSISGRRDFYFVATK